MYGNNVKNSANIVSRLFFKLKKGSLHRTARAYPYIGGQGLQALQARSKPHWTGCHSIRGNSPIAGIASPPLLVLFYKPEA
ncbi:hypothetical protein ASL22_09225 [Alcaligenes faecalis]|nr:hypothetical protein ASL22_09225 [Alcaligenes faecalis]